MSDNPDPKPKPRTPQEQHDRKVKNLMMHRTKRLRGLIRLGAPDIIICNEVKMIHNMLPLLVGYAGFKEHEAEEEMARQKNKLLVCRNKDCYNKVEDENGDIGDMMCLACSEKHQDLMEQYEKAADEMDEEDLKRDYDQL